MNKKKTILSALLLASMLGVNAQNITTRMNTIDLGQVVFRQPVSAVFDLTNKSNSELRIEEVRSDCGCTKVDFPINGIAAGSDFKVSATYDAKTLGHFEKQIGVYEAGSSKPLMLTIKGTVVSEIKDFDGKYPYTVGEFQTDAEDVEFDDVNRGDQPIKKLHIRNNSDQVSEPQVMHLPSYLKAKVEPQRIAPGHDGVITLQLDSHQLRELGLNQTDVYLGFAPGDKVANENSLPISAVLLPSFANLTAAELANAPRFNATATKLDLGAFGNKKKLKGEIIISNTGKSTLEIRGIQMSEAGLEVSLNNSRIEPGQSAKLKINALKGLMQRRRPRVLLITNDPNNSKVVVNVITK